MATVCCLIVNAAGQNLRPALPSDASRQFNPMYLVAPAHFGYNHYNPYGGQVMMPSAAGGFYPHYYPFAAGWRYPSADQGILTNFFEHFISFCLTSTSICQKVN